ncbi:hypothetical protein CORT_0A09150 [Candida orthopsilosis Co 90-125]|uniref:CID domain-containing protein n=1 Tax=Candida orthopsilosis (strain 90-125) TaxID=1136231 RepID=H8WYI4_CANO9|nr:hypothetical protein CORT_0A09150 [Candida orthopsilosis Co 90-125]CCG21299.1 hypothetical protein CORT_0A09150 [Candida orthopsilosis Co 90-125]
MSKTNSVEPEIVHNVSYVEQFKEGLRDLSAKKAVIERMTQLANNAADDARLICKMIETKLFNSNKQTKIFTFYLIDSIIKALPAYNTLFAPRIYDLFVHAYTTCSTTDLRDKLMELAGTWSGDIPSFSKDILDKVNRFLQKASHVTNKENIKAQLTPDGLTNALRELLRYTIHLDWKLTTIQDDLKYLSERELGLYKYFNNERNNLVSKINNVLDSIQDDMRPKSVGENMASVFIQIPHQFKLHAPRYGQELYDARSALDRLCQQQDEFLEDIRTHSESLETGQKRKDAVRQRRMKFENFLQENCVVINFTPKSDIFKMSQQDFKKVIRNFGIVAVDKESVQKVTDNKIEEPSVESVHKRDPDGTDGEKVAKVKKEVINESLQPTLGDDVLGLFGGYGNSSIFGNSENKNRKVTAHNGALFGHSSAKDKAAEGHNDSSHSSHQSKENLDVEVTPVVSCIDDGNEDSQQDGTHQVSDSVNLKSAKGSKGVPDKKVESTISSCEGLSTSDVITKIENETDVPFNSVSSNSFHSSASVNRHKTDVDGDLEMSKENWDPYASVGAQVNSKSSDHFTSSSLDVENFDRTKFISDNSGCSDDKKGTAHGDGSKSDSVGQNVWMQDIEDDFENLESAFNEPTRPLSKDKEDDIPNSERVFNEPAKPFPSPEKSMAESAGGPKSNDNLKRVEDQETVAEKVLQKENISHNESLPSADLESNLHHFQSDDISYDPTQEHQGLTSNQLLGNAYKPSLTSTVSAPQVSVSESSENTADANSDVSSAKLEQPTPPLPPHTLDSNSYPVPGGSSLDFDASQIGFRPPTPPNASHAHVIRSKDSPVEQPVGPPQASNSLKRLRTSPGVEESSCKRLKSSPSQPLDSMDSNSHKVTASVAPPPAAASAVTDEVNPAEFKSFENIAQKSETDVPPPPSKSELGRKLSLSEFKLKRQRTDLHTAPLAISLASANDSVSNANTASTTTATTITTTNATTASTVQRSLSNQPAGKLHPPTGLRSILRDSVSVEGENKVRKRVRWDPALIE